MEHITITAAINVYDNWLVEKSWQSYTVLAIVKDNYYNLLSGYLPNLGIAAVSGWLYSINSAFNLPGAVYLKVHDDQPRRLKCIYIGDNAVFSFDWLEKTDKELTALRIGIADVRKIAGW